MPLIVYLDSLLFMSELFGFVNSRHFCHTEDMQYNRFSGLKILIGFLGGNYLTLFGMKLYFNALMSFNSSFSAEFLPKLSEKEIPPGLTYIPNQVVEGPFHTSALQMQSQEISKPFSLMLTCPVLYTVSL